MATTNNSLTALVQFQRRVPAKEGGELGVDGLRQQPPHPGTQHLGQRIVDLIWLAKRDNVILVRDVSLLLRPASATAPIRHPLQAAVTNFLA